MAIIKRRDRFVLFRLSQDEYQRLRAACEEDGAASISAFARAEILKVLDRDASSLVAQQLSSLQSSMELITRMLEAIVKSPTRRRQNRTVHQHDA
jgi:uncharacterized protein with PIN domain